MGRVKTKNIKRTAKALIVEYPEDFSENFSENKLKVDEFTTVQSKLVRNKIAGAIVAEKKKVID